jgi:hypothetical protein
MLRLAGAEPAVFAAADTDCDPFRTLAHLARCAIAIFLREAADMMRLGWVDWGETPIPFKDSIPEITRFNFSTSDCARSRFSRSSRSAFSRFDIIPPRLF